MSLIAHHRLLVAVADFVVDLLPMHGYFGGRVDAQLYGLTLQPHNPHDNAAIYDNALTHVPGKDQHGARLA